jgi:outer membrane protein assembly factor BamB
MVFIGGYDQTLHALDLIDKRQTWSKITNGEIQEAPAVGAVNGRSVVFWGAADRTVYAHDAKTGNVVWTRELVRPTSTMGFATVSAPLLQEGLLLITCYVFDQALSRNDQKGWLFGLEQETGREVFRYEVSQGAVGSPVGRVLNGRSLVFVAARKGLLVALNIDSQGPKRVWSYQMPHEVYGSPSLQAEGSAPLVFLGSKFGNLIALDALTGKERWKRMAGNWIDNSASVGEVNGESTVFVGSHDYNVYAFRSADGELLWKRHLGGEVYSAPAFFAFGTIPTLVVSALDNHVYAIDARDGTVVTSYYTGQPIWDAVTKGETLWGSPTVLEAGERSAIIHGSFNGYVYVLPLLGECSLRAVVQSASTLWLGLVVTALVFVLLVAVVVRRPGFSSSVHPIRK